LTSREFVSFWRIILSKKGSSTAAALLPDIDGLGKIKDGSRSIEQKVKRKHTVNAYEKKRRGLIFDLRSIFLPPFRKTEFKFHYSVCVFQELRSRKKPFSVLVLKIGTLFRLLMMLHNANCIVIRTNCYFKVIFSRFSLRKFEIRITKGMAEEIPVAGKGPGFIIESGYYYSDVPTRALLLQVKQQIVARWSCEWVCGS